MGFELWTLAAHGCINACEWLIDLLLLGVSL
jgi:hypothetical protein